MAKSILDISFDVSRDEMTAIRHIVDRGWNIDWLRKSYASRLDMHMDICAVHANGNPLRLDDLLTADDFNFAHDMSGICRHLDRETGELMNGFTPRFSKREAAKAA